MTARNQDKNRSSVAREPSVVAPETAEAERLEAAKPVKTRMVSARRVSSIPIQVVLDADEDEEASAPEDPDEQPLEPADDEEEYEPPKSDIELLLEQHSTDSEFWLRVDRLVNYEHDGRTDAAAQKKFCMNIKPPTLEYEDIISRANPHGGQFLIKLMQRGRGIVRYWDVGIDSMVIELDVPPAPPAAPMPVPVDPFEAITTQAEKINRMKHALLGDELRALVEARNTPATPAPASDNPFAALLPLAANNPALLDKLVDRMIPADTEGATSIVGDILKHPEDAIKLLTVGAGLIQQLFFTRKPEPQNGQSAPPQVNPIFVMLEPIRPLIEFICSELVNNAAHDETIRAIEQTAEQQPQLAPMLSLIASRSSVEVINLLADFTGHKILHSLKHGAEWIEGLQEQLNGEEEEKDGEPVDSGAAVGVQSATG